MIQPAGEGAKLEFRFRNGKSVSFEAHAVKFDLLLRDVMAYIKSRPKRIDWNKQNIGNLGHRLVQQNEKKYIGAKVADWSLELKPRENHFDRRITVTTPAAKSWRVSGQSENGRWQYQQYHRLALRYGADQETGQQ